MKNKITKSIRVLNVRILKHENGKITYILPTGWDQLRFLNFKDKHGETIKEKLNG